jgi:catechol 2,3-dioxygenase-like lactoylglutathione lyase family enzyme
MRKFMFILGLMMALASSTAQAQLAAPNDMGVSMGHVHLNVHDVDTAKQFWIMLGGSVVKFGPGEAIKFPGVLVLLRKSDPTGGSPGSVVDHIGFQVPDVQKSLVAWKAAGVKIETTQNRKQAYLYTEDNLKVEILEDATLTVPIKFHHVHYFLSGGDDQIAAIQAWYVKMFGAKAGRRAQGEAADLPGVNLTFAKSQTPTVATAGRALDHIGFEVQGLEAFCKKLEANGAKLDTSYRKVPELGIALAFLTDPWGTRIELTEGLSAL